jgi:hypothetical protein
MLWAACLASAPKKGQCIKNFPGVKHRCQLKFRSYSAQKGSSWTEQAVLAQSRMGIDTSDQCYDKGEGSTAAIASGDEVAGPNWVPVSTTGLEVGDSAKAATKFFERRGMFGISRCEKREGEVRARPVVPICSAMIWTSANVIFEVTCARTILAVYS